MRQLTELPNKSIARFFRRVNLFEYKSPEDYVSIDDFYKVLAYAFFYLSSEKEQQAQAKRKRSKKTAPPLVDAAALTIDDLTVTFVESRYPGACGTLKKCI